MTIKKRSGASLRWYSQIGPRIVFLATTISGAIAGIAAFITHSEAIKDFVFAQFIAPDSHLAIADQTLQYFVKTDFFPGFLPTREDLSTRPPDKRFYKIGFTLRKNPAVGLKDCVIVVDGDPMLPYTEDTKIGDVEKGRKTLRVSFALKMLEQEPKFRSVQVTCDQEASNSLNLSLH